MALGRGPGSGGWSTGSSAEPVGEHQLASGGRFSLDEASAMVEEQRRAHTEKRRTHENNKRLAADELLLVEEEVSCSSVTCILCTSPCLDHTPLGNRPALSMTPSAAWLSG